MAGTLAAQAVHLARIVRYGGRTEASPDRSHLTSRVLPAFARLDRRLLWIGVRPYTRGYYAILEREGAECWTLDVDPDAASWGHEGRHVVGDLLDERTFPAETKFAGILCNGVFGYGIDDEAQQAQALRRASALLEPRGWLLLGWNTHRCSDPRQLLDGAALEPGSLAGLRSRAPIRGTTHVFDLLQRRRA